MFLFISVVVYLDIYVRLCTVGIPALSRALQMVVVGYILSVHTHNRKEHQQLTPGNTPVKPRHGTQAGDIKQVTLFIAIPN